MTDRLAKSIQRAIEILRLTGQHKAAGDLEKSYEDYAAGVPDRKPARRPASRKKAAAKEKPHDEPIAVGHQ